MTQDEQVFEGMHQDFVTVLALAERCLKEQVIGLLVLCCLVWLLLVTKQGRAKKMTTMSNRGQRIDPQKVKNAPHIFRHT